MEGLCSNRAIVRNYIQFFILCILIFRLKKQKRLKEPKNRLPSYQNDLDSNDPANSSAPKANLTQKFLADVDKEDPDRVAEVYRKLSEQNINLFELAANAIS